MAYPMDGWKPPVPFAMIGTAPELTRCSFAADLLYRGGRWEWWEPGRPHGMPGTPPVEHDDGWWSFKRTDFADVEIWFKMWGAWVAPYAPSVTGMTDEEALAWAARFWEAELASGGG